MIRSLKRGGLLRRCEKGDRSGIRPDLIETVENILMILDSAGSPKALDLPRYRLHALKDDRKGYCAVTVRANWRIIFRFMDGDACDIELIDYH